jgi:hypothetical protein
MIALDDYLKLLREVADSDNDLEDCDIPEDAWIPAEPAAKELMNISSHRGPIDITKFRRADIGKTLLKYDSVLVGSFLVRIDKSYNGNNPVTHLDLELWEKQYKTPSGNPCNMDFRINIHTDSRFTNCSWLPLFSTRGNANNVLIATAVDIIRWLQAIKRIGAFM